MDDRQRERLALESRMLAWSVNVRLLTQRLLSLGRPLDVSFDLVTLRQPKLATEPPARDILEALGLGVTALFQSSLLMVSGVDERARCLMRVSSAHMPSAPQELPITGVASADYLVGLNDLNLLDESLSLAQLRRRVTEAAARDEKLVLRFVRLDRLVRVDPSRGLGHGHVLQALAEIERSHARMVQDYDELLRCHRALVTKRLVRSKKLLTFVAREAAERRFVAMNDELYRFMANFQHWYTAMTGSTSLPEDEGDYEHGEERENGEPLPRDDSGDVSMDDAPAPAPASTPSTPPMPMPTPVAQAIVEKADYAARAKLSRPERFRVVGAPEDLDTTWRPTLPLARLKWLPNAQALVSSFVDGLVESFVLDVERWTPAIVSASRAVADRLVLLYVSKLETTRGMDNATVRRDFLQHARMLRSNMAHRGNGQLRAELLAGAVSVEQLCSMTSEQLAPESLQAERQRRSEQHAKEITITAPVGPTLVKTKHGFKEVNFGGLGAYAEAVADAAPDPPTAAQTEQQQDAELAEEESGTDEVTTRFTEAVQIKHKRVKKSVSFADAPTVTFIRSEDAPLVIAHEQRERAAALKKEARKERAALRFTTDDARQFLRVLVDPAQDLLGMVQQFEDTVRAVSSLATMSRQFELAPGVQLYRDHALARNHYGVEQFYARLQLAHWVIERSAPSDKQATLAAVHDIVAALEHFSQFFDDLLERFHHEFHAADRSVRRVRDEMLNFLIQHVQIEDASQPPESEARVSLRGMRVVTARGSSSLLARDAAASELTSLIIELSVLRKTATPRPKSIEPEPKPETNVPAIPPPSAERPIQVDVWEPPPPQQPRVASIAVEAPVVSDRKRPYDCVQTDPESDRILQPPPKRWQDDRPTAPAEPAPPAFFLDTAGETTVASGPSREELDKAEVEGYQELVRSLFRNRDDVHRRVHALRWSADQPEKRVEMSPQITIVQRVTFDRGRREYKCELEALTGTLFASACAVELDVAARIAVGRLLEQADKILSNWQTLLSTYEEILKRKAGQNGIQADPTLSAGNETRKSRKVAAWVQDNETEVGHLAEYIIVVDSFCAVRHACLNEKMAKRAASEEFRDILESLRKICKPAADPSRAAPRAAAPARPPPPPPRPRVSNMIQCSDDSDFDGDDYSDDDDDDGWTPSIAAPKPAAAADTKSSTRLRVDAELVGGYDLTSERSPALDARFRAMIRSLFTPADELCAGIGQLRGALKYRGSFNTITIVPNVRATIRLERLGENEFDVFASVNDVLSFKASAHSKQEACSTAIDGVLGKLEELRVLWAQLLHFFHLKELGNANVLDSFNALRLANIAPITATVEVAPLTAPGNQVFGVVRVGNSEVFRVEEQQEEDAVAVANCRTALFLVDLIDKGLDPEPVEGEQAPQAAESVASPFCPPKSCDWVCSIHVNELGNRANRREFKVDATWCFPDRVPPAAAFQAATDRGLQLVHRNTLPMADFERKGDNMAREPGVFFVRFDAAFESGKFVNQIAEYNHKNRARAFVLEFELDVSTEFSIFVIPPGGSINSSNNLYWPRRLLPQGMDDHKAVYGIVIPRGLAATLLRGRRW
ncbi:hypothetical protein ATCC90586_000812 [Pythium insidiosum]|nr:hypothetical protein ATCC90586_000812 [Pythium insidiosum]